MADNLETGFENSQNSKNKPLLFLRTIIHVIFLIHHLVTELYGLVIVIKGQKYEHPTIRLLCDYAAAFGTNWNFAFQLIFLSLSLVHDILEWLDRQDTSIAKKIAYYRDVLFCGLVVPFTLFVSGMFWTIFWIDRELVFPKIYDEVVPWWFNQCVHTNIIVVVLVETLLFARRHPVNKKLELILNGTVGVIYAIIYYSIYFITNRWLYGVFGIMTWWQVCLYQILIWASTFIFYYIQFPINRLFHKENFEDEKTTADLDKGLDNPGLDEKPEGTRRDGQKIQQEYSSL